MEQFWAFVSKNLGVCITILLALFEITPIPVKPISWLAKWIGKVANKELSGRLDKMDKRMDNIESKLSDVDNRIDAVNTKITDMENNMDLIEMDRIRSEVLRFADEMRQGIRHSKESFDHILNQADKYDRLLKKTKTDNGVFKLSLEFIKGIYNDCLKQNDFI